MQDTETFRAPSDGKNYSFGTLKLRELNGRDDVVIARRTKALGVTDELVMTMERVRQSIVEVDGKAVPQPYEEFDTWNERSRTLAMVGYQKVAGILGSSVEGFLKGSSATSPTQP